MAGRDRSPKRIKVEAYKYAADEYTAENKPPPKPKELTRLSYIDRFGVMAVTGQAVLPAREIRKMLVAENILLAYNSRKKSDNWGKWAEEHPDLAKILEDIEVQLNVLDG